MEKRKHKRLFLPPLAPEKPNSVDPYSRSNRDKFQEFVIRHYVKTLGLWFDMWQPWQRRVLICQMMNHCSKQLLRQLATSMEPVLHLDFSTSLLPPLQALHLQGTAKFQVLRCITRPIAKPEILTQVSSRDYLSSLPSMFGTGPKDKKSHKVTLANKEKVQPKHQISKVRRTKRAESIGNIQTVQSVLPLMHPKHISTRSTSTNATGIRNETGTDIHRRFSSVPEFKLISGQLKRAVDKESKERRLGKAISATASSPQSLERKAETFKEQLLQVASWMKNWEEAQKLYLLNQIVKFCDKDLLGYFVQCLHQQLTEIITIEALPDSALYSIFSYLEAADLCKMTRVCKRWNIIANTQSLWKGVTQKLGKTLGMYDMALLIETVAKFSAEENKKDQEDNENEDLENESMEMDWKRAYRQLLKLIKRMKEIVIKRAVSTTGDIQENPLIKKMGLAVGKTGRANFTLQEMLQILRAKCSNPLLATTYDLVQMAPLRPEVLRRKKREKEQEESVLVATSGEEEGRASTVLGEENEEEEANERGILDYNYFQSTITPKVGFTDLPKESYSAEVRHGSSVHRTKEVVELLDSVTDLQPSVPHLPDLDGIQCLILSGGLLSGITPRPGRIMSVSKTKRLEELNHVVLCLQCDSHKIVMGTTERNIEIIDIRTGRRVSILEGHKGSVHCLQFDDYKVVSGSWDRSCIIWDVIHHRFLKQIVGHTDTVSCLQFDEDIMVTGSFDGSLRVWSTSSWGIMTILGTAHLGGVTSMKFNNKVIASGGFDKTVKIWSRESYHCLAKLPHQSPLTAIGLSQLLLVSCSLAGIVVFWSLDTYESVMRRKLSNNVHIKQIVSTQSKFYGATSGGTVVELDVCTGTCMRTLLGHSRSLTAIWLGEHKLVTAGADNTVVVWYFKKAVELLEGTDGAVRHMTLYKVAQQEPELQEVFFENIPICTAKTNLFDMQNF